MNKNKLQIWFCFGIILICLIVYIVIAIIPWDDIKKKFKRKDDECETFCCPWVIIKELSSNDTTQNVFKNNNKEDNKQLLDVFCQHKYKKLPEELKNDMYKQIIDDIVKYVKTNNITTSGEFISKLS